MNPLAVSLATEADLRFVSQDAYLPERLIRRKIDDGDVIVADRGEGRVGYLRVGWLWSKLPYIELVRVVESHQRSGVGRALLAFVETELARQGHLVLYSSSQLDEPESQAWHRRIGFVECGIIAGINEGGVGELFFRKPIGSSR